MGLLVQKFDEISVQTEKNRRYVINKIKEALDQQYKVIVVVSALGRNPYPYATDTLVNMVDEPRTANEKRELDLLMSCGEIIKSSSRFSLADRKSTRLNSSHVAISYAVFCLKKKIGKDKTQIV